MEPTVSPDGLDTDGLDTLRVATAELLARSQGAALADLATAVETSTAAVRLLTEAQKAESERRMLALDEQKLHHEVEGAPARERAERRKDYVTLFATVFAPVLTFLALALTLFAQNWQFREVETQRTNAEQDAQWTATVRTVAEDTKLPPAIVALQPFLASPRFADRARLTAIQLAVNGKNPVFFDELLAAAFSPPRWTNLNDLLAIDRGLATRNEAFVAEMHQRHKGPFYVGWNAEEIANDRYLSKTLIAVSAQIVAVLRTPPPPGFHRDLSRTYLVEVDLANTDLHDASIEGAHIFSVDLTGADLSHVTNFLGLDAYGTAWWEARAISPPLLSYLQSRYPCDPGKRYGIDLDSARSYTDRQCQASLTRLTQAAGP